MTADQIDDSYNGLVSSIDREFRRLKQALAEQEMKEEAERLKKIQVAIRLYLYEIDQFILVERTGEREKQEIQRRQALRTRKRRISAVGTSANFRLSDIRNE